MKSLSKKEFLKYAAVNEELKSLFTQTSSEYYEMESESFLFADEVDFKGKQLLIELDLNKKEIVFISDLSSLDKFTEKENFEQLKSAKEDLFKKAELLGFNFSDKMYGSCDEYTWHSLSTSVYNFKLDNLKKFVELWKQFDDNLASQ